MPINYKEYPANWKTEIRPMILKRAEDKCESCKIKNGITVIRGFWGGQDCYQDMDGTIFDADTSNRIGDDYLGEVHPTNHPIKIVLTIAHMDHDISNNDTCNLKALCQRCHNRHDIGYRQENRKRNKDKVQPQICFPQQ